MCEIISITLDVGKYVIAVLGPEGKVIKYTTGGDSMEGVIAVLNRINT